MKSLTENMKLTQTILQGLEKAFKWCKYVVRMEDNRWPRRIMIWSPEGRRERGRTEVKWEREIEGIMKQRNLISGNAINRYYGD